MGRRTKIDWCDATWNPVTGCLHGCEYCYARKIAERFGSKQMPIFADYPVLHEPVRCTDTYAYMRDAGISTGKIQPYPFDFLPTFHRYKLDEPQRWKKPRNIFVCSMADLFGDWVADEWIQEVFAACRAAPQHRYLFLTKNPTRYCKIANAGWLPGDKNFWYGSTITRKGDSFFAGSVHWNAFVSMEPLLEPLDVGIGSFGGAKWVIVGAETGNQKDRVTPEREWIESIVGAAQPTQTPVFMKESLRDLMGADFQQEFPWEIEG